MSGNAVRRSDSPAPNRLLIALCALMLLAFAAQIIDVVGFGGRPWYGYWDAVTADSGQPYVVEIAQPTPGGAAARAGLHDGDRIDLRQVDAAARVALLYQPTAVRPVRLMVQRAKKTFAVEFVGSSQYETNMTVKVIVNVVALLPYLLALCCAWLIALRRSQTSEGRLLCYTLLAVVGYSFGPFSIAVPSALASALLLVLSTASLAVAAILPVVLSARVGARSRVRTALELLVYLLGAASLAAGGACAVGMYAAMIDPVPLAFGVAWRLLDAAVFAAALIAVSAAVASASQTERPRAAWLLLPLPIALLLSTTAADLNVYAQSWGAFMTALIISNGLLLAGIVAVTYALLKRRVLDIQFVIGRTLVVAGVSGVIVISFVLLEWLLGHVLENVGHVTGLVANAALALALGLSLQFVHTRVDAVVDFAFFHKRHESERALRDFAKEAAFVTKRDALLDQTLAIVQAHTDARAGSVLLDGDGTYRAVRGFGETQVDAGENDAAILAMKTWHKPVDPHGYETTLSGDLALPMLARGRLLGVLLCGERRSGEAYTPDEVDALTELAYGVGSALEAIDYGHGGREQEKVILAELRALRETIERRLPGERA
jgi:GAF domain-containing protein